MKATTSVSDLSRYKQKLRWQAEPGVNGAGGRKTGRNGKDITLDVPVGTVAIDPDGAVIADLEHPGAKAVIARGGSGLGSSNALSSPSRLSFANLNSPFG